MMKAILTILIHLALISTIKSSSLTAIVIKPNIQDYTNSFDLKAQSFKELVKKNKIFIDNTLFIKDILTYGVSLYMTGKRKCGKTINLDTLKTFLEIQVDEQGNRILPKNTTSNYKLFVNGEIRLDDGTVEKLAKPFLISQHRDIVDSHLGEYPVIFINFKDVKGNNLKEIEQSISQAIRGAFQHHKYMVKALNNTIESNSHNISRREEAKTHLKTFVDILNNQMTTDNLAYYIQTLHQILSEHFNQNAIFMYDDYDKPLTNILLLEKFPAKEVVQVMQSLDSFIILSEHTENLMHRSDLMFIAGAQILYRPSTAPWINSTRLDLLLVDNSQWLIRHFGFHEDDVQRLHKFFNIPSNLSVRAHQWYKGAQKNQYNLFSMLNFFNTKKIDHYFNDEEVEAIAPPLLNSCIDARETLMSLLSKAEVTTSFSSLNRRICETELFQLKPHTFNANSSYDCFADTVFAWYLTRKGYLGIRPLSKKELEENPLQHEIQVLLPNTEIGTLFSSWLITYYQAKYNIGDQVLENASVNLLRFVDNENSSLSTLADSLTHLYQSCKSESLSVSETYDRSRGIEDPFQALFSCVALKTQYSTELGIQVSYPYDENPNYVIFNTYYGRAVILQIYYKESDVSLDIILRSVENHVPRAIRKLNNPKTIRLLVIKVWSNMTVQINAKPYIFTPNKSNHETTSPSV